MRCSCATSARRGTLSRISVSSVSRLAIISGNAAFLAPEIGIAPWSGRPPTIRMRSITMPPREPQPIAPCVKSGQPAVAWARALVCLLLTGKSGGIKGLFRGIRIILTSRARPRLHLAALQVLPQRGAQPVAPPGLLGLWFLHHDLRLSPEIAPRRAPARFARRPGAYRVGRKAVRSSGRAPATTGPPVVKMISVPGVGTSRHIMVVTLSRLTQMVCFLVSLHFAHEAMLVTP